MQHDDVSDIRRHYQVDPELESERLTRHPIEFEITMRYFKKFLPETGSVLDLGCGTGRYTVALAEAGYDVTAADLSPALVDLCAARARQAGVSDRVQVHVADARDLSFLPEASFDAAVVMGPLYHLVHREDRQTVISETVSKLKAGAAFLSAHISRFGMLPHVAMEVPDFIEKTRELESLMCDGHNTAQHPRDGSFRAYFTTIEELAPLHEEMGLETIVIGTSDPASVAIDHTFRSLPTNQQRLWLDLLFSLSTMPSFRGAWPHLLYVGKKP